MAFNNPPQLHSNLPDIANHPAFKDSDQIDPAPPRKKSAEVTEDSVHDTGAQAQPPPVPPKSKRRTPEEWSRFARTRVPLTLEHAQSGDKVICCCLSDGAIGAVHYTTYGAILDELEKERDVRLGHAVIPRCSWRMKIYESDLDASHNEALRRWNTRPMPARDPQDNCYKVRHAWDLPSLALKTPFCGREKYRMLYILAKQSSEES